MKHGQSIGQNVGQGDHIWNCLRTPPEESFYQILPSQLDPMYSYSLNEKVSNKCDLENEFKMQVKQPAFKLILEINQNNLCTNFNIVARPIVELCS